MDPRDPRHLDDDELSLSALIGAERRHPGPPSGAEARVRAAIAASIAATAVGSGAAAATSGAVASSTAAATSATSTAALSGSTAVVGTSLAAKLSGAGVVVAALAATGGGALFVSGYEAAPTSASVTVEQVQPTPPPGLVVAAAPLNASMTTPATSISATTTATPTRSSAIEVARHKPRVTEIDSAVAVVAQAPAVAPVVVDEPARVAALAAERRQLGVARAALTAGDGRQALALLDGHRATWPDGQLVEEREALIVLSLARLGRRDDARAAATTFRARWPKSLFVDAIVRAVGP